MKIEVPKLGLEDFSSSIINIITYFDNLEMPKLGLEDFPSSIITIITYFENLAIFYNLTDNNIAGKKVSYLTPSYTVHKMYESP